jgi:hypothetical protein
LKNIVIVRGRGEALVRKVEKYINGEFDEKVKTSNVIMAADISIEKYCSKFKEEAVITFVDDSRLTLEESYYPIVEVILFTLARALHQKDIVGYGRDKLEELFKSINAETLSENSIYDSVLRIALKPAEPFEYDELQHIYRNIQKYLKAA